MAIHVNAFEAFIGARVIASLGTDDAHLVPIGTQRTGFLPHAAIERNGQILDDDENALPFARCGHGTSCGHWGRSVDCGAGPRFPRRDGTTMIPGEAAAS